jgi:hypothetical protein
MATTSENHGDTPYVGLLTEIYGAPRAASVVERYEALVARHVSTSTWRKDHLRSSDAWLIAYPDHISSADASPLSTLDTFVEQRLKPYITNVHILPCFPSSSDEGFSVMDYTDIDKRYGTWEDVERLGGHVNLMLDAVVNHASVQGTWFKEWQSGAREFEDFFRTEKPEADLSQVVRARQHPLLTAFRTTRGTEWVWTTFSEDQADLDYRNPEVTLAIADVLLTYAQHGASAIRLDAVGFLWKEAGTPSIHLDATHKIVQLMRATLDATYPDVLLVSETNVPHAENISYLGNDGVREADMVYQFPLPPLTLHAFTTGDATALKEWLETVDDTPPSTTYFNFLASHDGVGLRPLEGLVDRDEVQTIVDACVDNGGLVTYRSDFNGFPVPYELNGTWFDLVRGSSSGDAALQRHIASHGLMLALRGEPAIYMQALLAESNDVDLAHTTSQSRSVNRRRFTIDSLNRCLDDPESDAARSLHALLEMLQWRGETDAFLPVSEQRVLDTPSAVIGIERRSRSGAIARVYVNVGSTPQQVTVAGFTEPRGFNMASTGEGVELRAYGIAWITSSTPWAT